ncbi:MAG: SDR family oxidoreductase [Desulfobacterales bacterium]|nr:MAG: SDR family oxidoreductase [Desulfobacterales bacterium]
MMTLKNRVALITGASRGIGRSVATAFATAGADVILVARSGKALEEVAGEIVKMGRQAFAVSCDVSSGEEVDELNKKVSKSFDRLDILVNSAGISKRSRFLDYDDETWFEVVRVNLFGVYLITKAFLPKIEKTGSGRIINIASVAGKAPVPFNTAYSASKHGVLGLTKSLASEIAQSGFPQITVNAICPYFVETDMLRGKNGYHAQMAAMSGKPEAEIEKRITGQNLQKRVLEPQEIAAMAVYLASDDARGVTGQAFNICGGRIFH